MRTVLAAISMAALTATATPAPAQTTAAPQPLTAFSVQYVANARGVDAGRATYSYTFANGRYTGTASHRLTGLARQLAGTRQDFDYTVSGVVSAAGALQPRSYRQTGGRRNRVITVAFSDRSVDVTANPDMGMGTPPATAAQRLGTVDQVTMMAQMLTATGNPCRQTVRVFLEGRRRFDLVMSPNGTQNVTIAGWRGTAQRCSVRFTPIAGFSDPIEASTMTFLFAPVNGYNVPLQIQMPTDDAGIVRLTAQRYTLQGAR